MVFSHQNWLNQKTYLTDIVPKALRKLKFLITISRHYDSYVDVAVRCSVAYRVGTKHHDSWLTLEMWPYDTFVVSDEVEGFVAVESSSFIYCINCLVSRGVRYCIC